MMKYISKILFFSIFLSLPCCDISAGPVTAYEAESAVKGWLKKDLQPLGVPLGHQIAKVETFASNRGTTDYYVVYLKPSGFVIVSADDLIEPIIGFADDGIFVPDSNNPLGALVNNDLNNRISRIKDSYNLLAISESEKFSQTKAQNKWQTYLKASQTIQSRYQLMALSCLCDIRVPPLVQSRWGQEKALGKTCYNYYTNFGTPYYYPCGCLATAMAQLMRYFEYPTTGIGIREFTITVNGIKQSAFTIGGNNIGGPYKWNEMVLKPGSYSGSLSLAQRQAIGAICYDAGLALGMVYSRSGSGALIDSTKNALDNTFNYRNSVFGYNSNDNINTEDLYKMINPSLDAGSPVILSIFTLSDLYNGHAVICDGYAYETSIVNARDGSPYEISTLYHHLNMGWSGTDDVWYNLPDIDSKNYQFKLITSCLYNIFPSDKGEIISGRVLDPNNNPIPNAAVYAQKDSNDLISTLTNYRGIYAFKGLSSYTSYTMWANIDGFNTPTQTIYTKFSQTDSTTCGNVWGVNFYSEAEPNYAPASIYYVDNDAPNDPAPNYSAISDPNEDGSAEHPFDSIQEAIDASSHGDIVVVLQGTYTGTGNRDIDFNSKAITVRGENPNDPNLVIIDCNGTENNPFRGFVFQNYEIPKSVLSGITIKNGYYESGGAIYLTDCARPTITNCVFTMNEADYGGAIYSNNSCPVISNCIFKENQAEAGGAMYNYSEASGSKPEIISCNFNNNNSVYNGGAIYNSGKVTPTITKCIFNSNYSSGGGGAIRNNGVVNLSITNCIFSTNMSETYGGGIRSSKGGIVKLTNCTFYANISPKGNSLACSVDDENGHLAGSVQIINCIIRDGGGEIFNNDNSTINVTYSNLKDTATETPWPGEGNIYTDPLFADIETGDFHLKSMAGRFDPNSLSWILDEDSSLCIDAGNPESQVNDEPEPNGDIINMGAYGSTDQASKTYLY